MNFNSAQAMLFGFVCSDWIFREIVFLEDSVTEYHLSEGVLNTLARIGSLDADTIINMSNLIDCVILVYLYQAGILSLKERVLNSSEDNERIASWLGVISLTKCILDKVPDKEYFSIIWEFSSGIGSDYDMTIRKIGHVLGWGSEVHAIRHLGTGETPQEVVTLCLYCLLRYPNSYHSAIKVTSKIAHNNKIIAQIIGSLMGLKLGLDELPQTCVKYCKHRKYILKLAQDLNAQRLSNVK